MRNFTKTGSDRELSPCSPTTAYGNPLKWVKFLIFTWGFLFLFAGFVHATDVGGYIYCDKNSNGSYNSGEELELAGLEVKIYNKGTNNLLKTVTTDANGFYNATPITNGTQVDAKVVYNGTTYTATVTSPTSTAHIKVVCTPTTCSNCTSPNLVTNPTFDSDANGWTATNGELTTATGGPPAIGRYLLLNNSDKSGNYSVYQDIPFGANKQYNYSGVAAKHSSGNNSKVYLEFYNGNTKIGSSGEVFITVNFNSTAFQSYSIDGITPANTTKIRIVGYCNGTALKMDNQKLTTCNDTPELSVAKDGDLTCTDTSVKLTATSNPSSGVTYDWTVPGGATDPGNVASFNTGTPGNYSVKVTIPGTGASCSVTKSITVTKTDCPPCTTCVSANLVTNPNFDSNTNSWTATNGELSYGTGGAFGGFLVLNNSDKSGNYYVYQDITIGPNKYYNYTGKAAKHSTGTNSKVYLEFYNGTTKIGTTSEFIVTKNYDGTFQDITPFVGYTPANTTKIRIVGYANGTALKLDNQILTTCYDTPTVTVDTDGKLTCTKTSVKVTATANPSSGITYAWTVPNGVTNPGNVASFNTTVPGDYKVKVTIPGTGNGCSAEATTTVTQDATKPTVSLNTVKLTCTTTSATLTATTTPASGLTYAWTVPGGVTNPGNVASFTVTVPGAYSVTVTNPANGCTATASTTVTQDATKPTVSLNTVKLTCTTTSATLTATTTPASGLTYAWTVPGGVTNPGSVASFTVTVPGAYSVTVTNPANGCTATASTTVTQDATKPTVSLNTVKLTCTTTSATLTATTTPASGLTYAWTVPGGVTNPGSVASFTVTVPGSYSVTVTNPANGCTATASTTVTQDATKPTVSLNTVKLTCTTTSATLTATTTPASGLTYAWTVPGGVTNPGSVASFTVTVPGSYSVTVTNPANGCTATASTTVTQDADKPTVVANGGQLTCDKTSLSITANGSPASVTYSWTGPGGFTSTAKTISATAVGTYTVTVTNPANGCTASDTAVVSQDNNKPTVVANGGQLTCDKTSLSITANGSPASVTYAWTGPGGFTATTKTISVSVAGTYTVTVKNPANGCTASDTAVVSQDNNKPTVAANGGQLTCDKTSLSITANGSPASVTYSWTGPGGFTSTAKTITATTAGTYTVTVKNPANGCTASDTAVVSQDNNKPTVVANGGQLTCDKTSLSITANGSPASVTYAWTGPGGFTSTAKTISATAVGTYTVTVTNPANGCTASDTAVVSQDNNKPTVVANGGQLTCDKTSLSITANGSPASVTYAWTGPGGFTATTKTITATTAGTYTVTVKNPANGCTASDTAVVSQDNNKPTVAANGGQLTCDKTSLSITADGSPASVTYAWTGPGGFTATTKTITATTAGTYTVTVKNPANGCTASDTAVVSQNIAKPTVQATGKQLTCQNTSVSITATGTPSGITFSWTGPGNFTSNSATINVNTVGVYTVTATNPANGCTASDTAVVTQSTDKPTVSLNNLSFTCLVSSGTLTATGSNNVDYSWTVPNGVTNPGNVASFNVTVPGSYMVTVTSKTNGCTATATSMVVLDNKKPVITLNDLTLTCDNPSQTLTATVTPSTGVTYKWTVPAGATDPGNVASFTVTVAGTYSVVVTNTTNGCQETASKEVKENKEKPTVVANGGQLTCDKTSLSITANGSPASVTYAWTGPGGFTSTAKTISATTVGTYTVTVTNPANGCTASDTAVVSQDNNKPTVVANGGQLTCDKTSLSITANGSPASVTYAWTGPGGFTSTAKTITATTAGTYTVTVKNPANGCTASDTAVVSQSTDKPTVSLNEVVITCEKPSATLTATTTPAGGLTYAWTVPAGVTNPGNVASFTVTTAGTYSVTVTNPANGCTATATTIVTGSTVKPTVIATGGQLNCDKTSIGIKANATPAGVTYSWTGPGNFTATSDSINVSAVGTYTVTVTNPANGCTASDTAVVSQDNNKPTVVANGGQLTCDKTSLSITANGSPASVTYAWTGPGGFTSTAKTITATTAGTYTVTVKNPANGCTASDTAVVSQSTDKPTVSLNEVVITCEKPSATLTATTTPASGLTYAWTVPAGVTNPGNVASFTVTVAGDYSVTVTASNGCTATATTKVTGSTDKPTVVANGGQLTCDKTSLSITANGSPASVTYSWTGPGGFTSTAKTITATTVGTYTVTVTNPANGCTASDTAVVSQDNNKPTVVANGGQLTCDKTSLSITADGSPASVTYAWTGPGGFTATTKTITATTAGTYTVTVKNPANGCTASDTAVVSQSTDKPTVSLNEVVITCEKPSATLTATTTPASGLTYAWTVPAGVTNPGNVASFTVTVAGDYSVTVTASNGCTATATTKVTGSTDKPTVSVTVGNQAQLTCAKPSLVIKAVGTPQGVTYLWMGPGGITATVDSITASVPGVYKVVVTNPVNGCTVKDSVTITQSTDKPVVTLNDVTLTCDKPTATLTATPTPATGITYKWTVPAGVTDPGNVPSFTVSVPGTYTVMITSAANGCTATATTQVKLSTDRPDANPNGNITLVCQGSTPITTATLDAKPFPGAQWSQVGTTPSVVAFANVNDPKTTISGLAPGTYKLVWKAGDCADTLTVIVPDCIVNCVKPQAGPDVTVCSPATTSDLPDAGTNQAWTAGVQNPAPATINPQTGAVSGLTKDGIYTFILRDSNIGSTCADTVNIFRGIPNAPDDQSTCNDTLTLATVTGGTYSVLAGNPAQAAITPAGKITGLSAVGVYKFLLTKGQCTDTIKVEKLNCTKTYDLALDKAISKKVAQLGDTLTYTIRVWNEGEATAHGIEVTDTLNAGVQYISYTSTRGTYNAGKWKFDSIVVGDTVLLTVKVKVVAQGVWFNTAEITKMTEKDVDSTPGNGEDGEDDIDRECFTVPIEVCRGQAYVATVPAKYTNVVWFKDGQQVATGNSYTISESGQYTFTATGTQCPAQGCCPILVAVIDCCPVNVCVPVLIKKTRTAGR